MDAKKAAEQLLEIIQENIERFAYARYNTVRVEFAREVGDDWIVLSKRGRRNISPDVTAAMRALPGRDAIEWQAPRQRWIAKSEE